MKEKLDKILFKHSKPIIRAFEFYDPETGSPGDIPYLWDLYCNDRLEEAPDNLSMEEFLEYSDGVRDYIQEITIVEDLVGGEYKPIAVVLARNDGWILEPHVIYFDSATPRTVLRSYTAFLKKTKYRKDIGACLVRVTKDTTKLANRMEEMKLLEYVGKIWGGRPSGNEYLYSIRCMRRA